MCSRKGTPVSNFAWPVPSKFTLTVIWVSSVLRSMLAVRDMQVSCEISGKELSCYFMTKRRPCQTRSQAKRSPDHHLANSPACQHQNGRSQRQDAELLPD